MYKKSVKNIVTLLNCYIVNRHSDQPRRLGGPASPMRRVPNGILPPPMAGSG